MRPLLVRLLGEDIDARTLDRLSRGGNIQHHRRNAIIYRQGSPPDGIYLVGHGCVLLETIAPNHFVSVFRLASNGGCFGHRSFCGNEPRSTVARSVTASMTLHVPGAVLDEAVADDPGVFRALARLLAQDAGPKISKRARNGRTPVRVRLAYVLTELVQHLQVSESDEGEYFGFPLTQKDLSNMLDVSQETISRMLRQFEDENLLAIKHGPRRLLIPNRDALADIAANRD